MSNKTGEIDPIQKELAGRVREVGNHAIWSLSSCKPGFGVDQLRDDITETYWQSDGQLPHLVNIQFKRKTTICDICIYTDYKLDESYTPSRISIRAGTNFNDLQEIEVMDLNEPSGWVIIPIKDINDRPIRTFMIQIAVISNHQNGRDTHMRQINVYSPTQDIFGPPASYIAASKDFNNNTLSKINKKIMEYIKNAAKISFRYKRELYENSERDNINILNGFQDINKLNFEDVQDINFFSFQYEFETMWFVVILDTSKLSLYQINNGSFYNISDYFVRNGTQIIVNSCTYGALFIIQNQNGPVLILSFTKILDKYYLQQIQDFELNNTTHLSIWNGINQLHLAIVSHSNISIYTWFNNYFDLIQIINISTKKIIPFQSKGFMYLAVTGSTTLIFKYFLKSNKFLIIQRLPPSQDVSYFQLNKQHFMEYFLILSMKSSIIIYKELHNRFVPFQQISFSKIIVPIISSKAIVVLTLHKNTIIAYQYDGWKFIKINTKLSGIIQYNLIILYEKELLLIKNKNNKWTLKQLLWIKKKSYKDLREEIKIWNINVKNKLQKITEEIPNFKLNFKILKSHIDQLQVHNINDYNLQTLKNVSKQYNRLINKFQAQKIIINNKWQSKNLIATSLHAKKIQIKCKTNCKFNRLYVKENHNFLFKLIVSKNKNQLSDFKELNIKEIKNWKCPLLSLAIKDIIIHKMINGISLNYLQKNALKIINDQEVFGKHIFINMKAINVSMPLNIATYFTNQEIRLKEIKVKQLNLTTGGILLPLNSLSTTVINFIKTPQLKIKNNISLKGKQTGKGSMRLGPVIDITKSMNLYNNFNLENVKIENLKSIDLITKTGSIKNILSNAITLYENVPISLILSSEKMKWSNITLHKPKKWITVNFQNIIISGKKHIYHNVQITKFSYDNLKFSLNKDLFLKDSKLCATFIFAPKIRTLFLTGNNITVQKLISSHVFGNIGLYSINNSTVSFNSVLSEKKYCHNIIAKNIFALQLNNLNLTDLKRLINIWIEPSFLNTSINTINLITNILRSPFQFYIKLPKIIKNIIFEQNVLVNNINGINFSNFLLNTIKFNDMVSLQNITFRNGISTNDIYVSHLPFNLTNTKKDLNLYKKRISGSIKVNAINLPYVFKILENKTLVDISIMGSVKFCYEPTIKNINDIKLKKLSSEIWMVTNTITIFHGKNMHFHDIMIKKYVALNNLTNTLSFKMWNNSLKSILSKTKLQEIEFPASFNDIKISNIISSNISIIQSSLSDFNNIFENSLLKNKDQEVKTKWIFNKLKISDTGNLYIKQTINNLYFKSDVMKHNSKENIVTGKKKVLTLIVENLNGYNFNKWTTNALMRIKKDIIIKGRKKFSIVTFNNIKMSKTIMGYAIDKVLRKSTNQIIYSQKTIQGFISASEFIINGLINDVNLTKLVHHQLKKNNPLQTIRTGIELHNSLNIIGNLTIKGAYEKSEMKIFDKNYSNAQTIIKRIKKFIRTAEIINIALQNRAIYINKLEIINDTINAFNKSMIIQYNTVQCNSKKFSSYCISKYAKEFIFQTNISNFILLQSIMMDEKEFIILVKFNSISIYSFINIGNNFVHLKDLYFPNIMDAFVEQKWHGFGLWIILRLISQTLVLLYQPWGNIQQYILPVTDVFLINRSPNNQLLLLLSNGIWDLEGLASPRNIIEIPLKGRIETVADKFNYYVKCISRNETALMKARYI